MPQSGSPYAGQAYSATPLHSHSVGARAANTPARHAVRSAHALSTLQNVAVPDANEARFLHDEIVQRRCYEQGGFLQLRAGDTVVDVGKVPAAPLICDLREQQSHVKFPVLHMRLADLHPALGLRIEWHHELFTECSAQSARLVGWVVQYRREYLKLVPAVCHYSQRCRAHKLALEAPSDIDVAVQARMLASSLCLLLS